MSVFKSRVITTSQTFRRNRAEMLALVDKLHELNGRAAALSEQRKPRFQARGQLTPRERLARVLDSGMPWLVIGNLAGYLFDSVDEATAVPGSTMICGIGFIRGVRCAVVVDDSGIQGGAINTAAQFRVRRTQEIALRQNLPFVHLVESAGGDLLNYQVRDFLIGGGLFANLARLSAKGLPVISILHGSSTAGGAYMPGMSDYVVAVKGNGKAFLAGPPLLKAATGEIAGDEELGGAEMHASVSGLVEYLAEDDGEACVMVREVVSRLDWNTHCPRPPLRSFAEPLYDPDEIAGVASVDYRTPYEVRELMARIVDGSDFTDFKPRYGVSTVCAQGAVYGQSCAMIGNNGPIDPEGATKAAQFLQLMDQSGTPVVFLQNTTGFLVGKRYEQAGMIKHGSKMIQSVTNISVPRLTFMTGASFGAGNYGMCGRGYDPDFLFSWPNAATGVMGGEQAATVMSIVAEGQAKARGKEVDRAALAKQEQQLLALYGRQASGFFTSGNLLDDGMIDPRDTRKVLGFLLGAVWEGRHRTLRPNSFGVARM